jgi:hypothetical protein
MNAEDKAKVQEALEVFELVQRDVHWMNKSPTQKACRKAEKALRQLLEAEPMQEPKFWYDEEMGELYSPGGYRPDNCTPLYTHPPAQPAVPWSNALESVWGEPAKLREKNGGAA